MFLASYYFKGDVSLWFRQVTKEYQQLNWHDLKLALLSSYDSAPRERDVADSFHLSVVDFQTDSKFQPINKKLDKADESIAHYVLDQHLAYRTIIVLDEEYEMSTANNCHIEQVVMHSTPICYQILELNL